MAIHYNADYVKAHRAMIGLGDYYFIGTKDFVFAYPVKFDSNEEKLEFFISGDNPRDYLDDLLENPDMTPDKLKSELQTLADNFEKVDYIEAHFYELKDYPFMKVSANLLGSSLMLGKKKIGSKFILANFSKQNKKDIKNFYNN